MENANLYSLSNALQKRDAQLVLQELVPLMSWKGQGETVLDVGCGSGDVTKSILLPLLPVDVARIVGVDLSHEMVNYASKHFHHNLIEYLHLDISSVNNPRSIFPQGFTKITSFYCLHWIQDHRSCLENMFDLLEGGGQTLLVFLASNPIFLMYERISLKPRWSNYMKDVSLFVPTHQHKQSPHSTFQTLAEDVGFESEFCEATEMTFSFENKNYLKKALAAVNPFVSRIPENERETFLDECLNELIQMCPTSATGGTIANYKLMVALFTKPDEE